ncbi:MAG: hypothetical protein Hals2KO_26780 [Halioglobus sp.]
MNSTRLIVGALALSLLAACSDSNNDSSATAPVLTLNFSESPIELPGIAANYAADVAYGAKERNLFDIYLPQDCDGPTPLVIYIHGGGFTGGDKANNVSAERVNELLQNCIAHAAINYTLLDVPSEEEGTDSIPAQGGVLTSLQDAARALQFMRYHHASLNLDKENVALYGGSAGAGASLWLGTHDDMADPDNADPVLRESTRIKAAGALATQSTYDILDWSEILLPITEPVADILGGTDVETIAAALGSTNYLLTFLGVASAEAFASAENQAYRAEIDMLELMDAGDAPIYVHNFETSFANPLDMFLHHGVHALAVKARADEVGLHSVAYVDDPAFDLQDPSGEGLTSFMIRHIR